MADANTQSKKGSIYQIGTQFFYIEISFYNQIPGQQPIYVPFFFVDSLTITETLHTWIVQGSIVINTDFEVFSRGAPKNPGIYQNTQSPDTGNIDTSPPYIDRTDGRNRLSVIIYPVKANPETGTINNTGGGVTPLDLNYYELNYNFIITNVQDLPTESSQRKKRKYYFIDEKFQLLKERNLEWSSAALAKKLTNSSKNVWEMTEEEKQYEPNLILKEFLNLAGKQPSTKQDIMVGFTGDSGSIDKPNVKLSNVISSQWDNGLGNGKNKFIYHTTARKNALQDLNYILSWCQSSTDFPVLLRYGRSSLDKGWKLIGIDKFFQEAGAQQIESLYIVDGMLNFDLTNPKAADALNSTSQPNIQRGANDSSSDTHNFTSIMASLLTNYKFSPMVSIDDMQITNKVLHWYDHNTGTFSINASQNTVKAVLTKLKELGKYLYSFQHGQNAQILLNINETKKSGVMLSNVYSAYDSYVLPNSPQSKMILAAIFLNQSLTFQSLGLTMRTPGKFFNLVRLSQTSDKNAFDDRFLGPWMFTQVTHMFTQETYINEVVANKIDTFSQIFPEVDSNI